MKKLLFFILLFSTIRFCFGQNKIVDSLLKVLESEKNSGNNRKIAGCYNNIGCEFIEENPLKAKEYLMKAIKIADETKDKNDIANFSRNLATTFSKLNDIPNAEMYYKKALENWEALNDKKEISNVYTSMSLLYRFEKPNYKKALEYKFKSMELVKEVGTKRGLAFCYFNIGELYSQLNNYKQAIVYLDSSYSLGQLINDNDIQKIALSNLSLAYAKTNDFKKAYELLNKENNISSSSRAAFIKETINNLQKLETENKDLKLKINGLQSQASAIELSKKRIMLITITGFSVLLLIIIVLFFRKKSK